METLLGYDAEPSENQKSALGFMSRIYLGKSNQSMPSKKMILVKAGLQVEGDVKMGVVYQLPQGFLVHFQQKEASSEDSVISFYFEGFSSSNVEEIKGKISKDLLQSQKTVLLNCLTPQFSNQFSFLQKWLMPMSFAAVAENGLPALCGGSTQVTTKSQGGESSMLKNTWNCTKGVGGGVWDSTGGLVTDTAHLLWAGAKGAGKAIIHPVETYEAASAEMKKYKAMFSDLEKSFGTLKEAYNQLPDEVKWKMGCEITGQLGTTGVITYLTAGGGSPAFLRTISNSLYRVAEKLPAGSAAAEKAMNLSKKMSEKAVAHEAQLKPHLKESPQNDIAALEEKLKSLVHQRQAVEIEQQLRRNALKEELQLAKEKLAAIKNPSPIPVKNSSIDMEEYTLVGAVTKYEGRLDKALQGLQFFGMNDSKRKKLYWDLVGISQGREGRSFAAEKAVPDLRLALERSYQSGLEKGGKLDKILDNYAKELGVTKDQMKFAWFVHDGDWWLTKALDRLPTKEGPDAERFVEMVNKSLQKKGLRKQKAINEEIAIYEKEKADAPAVAKHKEKLSNEIRGLETELAKADTLVDVAGEKALQKDIESLQKKLAIQSQDVKMSEKEKMALAAYMGVTACRSAGVAVSPPVTTGDQRATK